MLDEMAPPLRPAPPEHETEVFAMRRRLRQAGHAIFRLVELDFFEGIAVLRGIVPTYHAKQQAQALLLLEPAVETIENLIEVVTPAAGRRRGEGRG